MSSFNPSEYDPSVVDTDLYEHPNRQSQNRRNQQPQLESDKEFPNSNATVESHNAPVNENKEPKVGFFRSIGNFFTDRRTHGVLGLAFILFAAYVLIASLSYFVSGKEDLSAISSQTIEQMAASGSTENIAGPSGAVLSQVILTNSFGLGAVVMIIYMILIGLALLKVRKVHFWALTFKSFLIAITISIVAGLLTYSMETPFLYGGQHGRWVNKLLLERTGVLGTTLVSVFLVGCIIFIYLNELIGMYRAYRRRIEERRELERKAREEKERRIQLVKENVTDENADSEVTDANPDEEQKEQQPEIVGFLDNPSDEDSYDDPHRVIPGVNDSSPLPDRTDSNESEEENTDGDTATTQALTVYEANNNTTPIAEFEQPDEPVVMETPDAPAEFVSEQPLNQPEETIENINDDVEFKVVEAKVEKADDIMSRPFDPTAELPYFKTPPIEILKDYTGVAGEEDANVTDPEAHKNEIIHALASYGVQISKVEATVGATVTLFEIIPVEGTRIQRIKQLGDDLMLSLSAQGIRIIAPIPGKGTIGIEVPNKIKQIVSIRSILSSKAFQESTAELPIALGTTVSNKVFVADLAKMPHLLVAGATGQGKSVGLNTIIASLLYKKHPATLKFVLVDPKFVEFSLYSCLENHFLAKVPAEDDPIITAPEKVVDTLKSLCTEMDDRYQLLRDAGCRNIIEYNNKFCACQLNPEKGHHFLPYIVIIVDEFGDLIMTAGKEVEMPIARIAQKARAVGMHMIIATQRPSTKIISGNIKANFPGRMAFKVAQGIDSQTILDRPGANQLIGKGDMLILENGKIERVQCAFIDTPEVEAICKFINNQQGYDGAYDLPDPTPENENTGNANAVTDRDSLFAEVARMIVLSGTASVSSLQRRYSIGFNRAGKIMDQMEAAGIVGPSVGGKPRSVLLDSGALEDLLQTMGIG